MSVMGRLLAGSAPLRGRASLELIVRPLDHRAAARFWGITDPRLAVLVHSIVGGTPAYRREFVAGDGPASLADFDSWVLRAVLNPQVPLFREVKWDTIMTPAHLDRLRRARDLLAVKGHDTADTLLTCYDGAGFDHDLRRLAGTKDFIRLIDLDELYGG